MKFLERVEKLKLENEEKILLVRKQRRSKILFRKNKRISIF